MSKRDVQVFILDMLDAIRKVQRYIQGMSYEEFEKTEMVLDAVVRNLEVIGEAARHVPEDLRNRYTELDWRRVVGFRNVVVHRYFDVDPEIVWAIATQHLGHLEKVLEQMLSDIKQAESHDSAENATDRDV